MTYGRMDNYLPTGGVGVRVTTSGTMLIETEMKRRWWWPWRKRPVTTPLAHSPHVVRQGDVITLSQTGPDRFTVTSNYYNTILEYPPNDDDDRSTNG